MKRYSKSNNGKMYYFHVETKESRWEPPEGTVSSGQPGKVRCSHLLVKHEKSRRPSSWKQVLYIYISLFKLFIAV
jgi:peptidyl-prolyl cis-trans isomerase NIMA-interacting 1